MKWKENILRNVVVAFKEPHRSTSGPLTETGDSTEYSLTLTNMGLGVGGRGGWGGVLFRWNEVFSLSPRAWPCGPLFWPKSNAGVWWPPTPPLDTPMSFLEVGALNLGCGPFMKVKKQMMRQNMKCGLLPAKMSPVFSWITVNKQSANVHFSLLTATIFKRNIHCPKRKRKEEIEKLLNKEFNT